MDSRPLIVAGGLGLLLYGLGALRRSADAGDGVDDGYTGGLVTVTPPLTLDDLGGDAGDLVGQDKGSNDAFLFQPITVTPALTVPSGRATSLSAAGLQMIKAGESFSAVHYNDVGHDAIGYGHDLAPGETLPATITEAQATQLLLKDVAVAASAINSLVKFPINQNQFDALASFVLNVGVTAFSGSTLLKKLNAGDVAGAAAQFAAWKYAGGKVNAGLVARRAKERALFLS